MRAMERGRLDVIAISVTWAFKNYFFAKIGKDMVQFLYQVM